MSSCCDRSLVSISLPRIEHPVDCLNVFVPCAFTRRAVNTAQFCLSCIPDNDAPSTQRQFAQCLRSKGLVHCEGIIQRPRLWVEALEQTIDRNGENFAHIYLSKL